MSLGLPSSAFKLADLSPAHTGAGQISSQPRKYPSPERRKGVQWPVAKANYHQIRRQKELARKTRQQEKQQKRLAAKAGEPSAAEPADAEPVGAELESSELVTRSTIPAGGQGPARS